MGLFTRVFLTFIGFIYITLNSGVASLGCDRCDSQRYWSMPGAETAIRVILVATILNRFFSRDLVLRINVLNR